MLAECGVRVKSDNVIPPFCLQVKECRCAFMCILYKPGQFLIYETLFFANTATSTLHYTHSARVVVSWVFSMKIIDECSFSKLLIACFYGITSLELPRSSAGKTNWLWEISVSIATVSLLAWFGLEAQNLLRLISITVWWDSRHRIQRITVTWEHTHTVQIQCLWINS